MPNLRVIYDNKADISTATITASTTRGTTTTANLKLNKKGLVWQSAAGTTQAQANLIISFGQTVTIGGLAFPFCNLSPTATIRFRGWTGTAPTHTGADTTNAPTLGTASAVQVFDSGTITAVPGSTFSIFGVADTALGVNTYPYGGGAYARAWVTPTACAHVTIEIVDAGNTASAGAATKYIELSRLVLGNYWSPNYNTSYGLSVGVKDTSINERAESGDLITAIGTKYINMQFELKYLDSTDRLNFLKLLKNNGTNTPIFVSLFPNDTDASKEQGHQIYGKITDTSLMQHFAYGMYSSQLDIEEI